MWIRWKLRCVVWVKGVEVEGVWFEVKGAGGGWGCSLGLRGVV